jgi:16S rRNA G966 N2-methylase RsmD/DNA-directed RNA polymerase subunit RPC12/RpoP
MNMPSASMKIKAQTARDVVSEYIAAPDAFPPPSLGPTPTSAPEKISIPASRNSAFYTAHSYHTKVPPEAIVPFIEHFTQPGDVVLDLFCGSGMTGVAAAMTGRNAILNDLSPAAVHLAWNHTNPCNADELGKAFKEIEKQISSTIQELYSTTDPEGNKGIIHWTMWSTRHRCLNCTKLFAMWDAVDRESGRMGTTIACPHCGSTLKRKDLTTIDSIPAWISYKTRTGLRLEKPADKADIKKAQSFSRSDINAWYPSVPLGADREMYIRCALHLKGIKEIADFYTARNLMALAVIWAAIGEVKDQRLRAALMFAFTNTAWHGTRMRRFNARGGQRPLTGTLYIPQLSSEVNVLEVMRNKIAQLKRYYLAFSPLSQRPPCILNGSATELGALGNESVDYIFTDPPFGSNLFYADCNLIWESWLGRITDPTSEAVVNSSLGVSEGGKTLAMYEHLMTLSLREMSRVLKPGGWATIVFHNTDGEVWTALHNAAVSSGFEFHEAASLDRKQQSHKGYKGRSGEEDVAHFDVVMNLRKPIEVTHDAKRNDKRVNGSAKLEDLVRAVAMNENVKNRGVQGIHAEVVRRVVSSGESVFFDYSDVRKILESSET